MKKIDKLPDGTTSILQNNQQITAKKVRVPYYKGYVNDNILKSTQSIYTDKEDKTGTIGSFFKGWTKTFDDLASGVNWAGEKITGALGLDSAKKFFHDNREYWNAQGHINNIQTQDHPTAHFVGEVLNPTLALPAGYFNKGKLLADAIKSGVAGGAIAGAEQSLSVAGRDDLSPEEKRNRVITAVALGGLGNVAFRGGEALFGKIFKKNPKVAEELHDSVANGDKDRIIKIKEAIKKNPEAFGLTKEEAKKIDIIPNEKPIEAEATKEIAPVTMVASESIPEDAVSILQKEKHPLEEWRDKDYSKLSLEELQQHPFYNDIIENLKDVKAKDKRYSRKLVSPRYINSWEDKYIPASYEPNYVSEYRLSKASVDRILKGKPTKDDLDKLREDLRYETERLFNSYKANPEALNEKDLDIKASILKAMEDGDYDTIEELLPKVNDEAFVNDIANKLANIDNERASSIGASYLFANANQRLAGGMLGGTYNALENADENNDGYVTDEERINAFLKGFGVGMLTPEALKVLEKTAPKTYEKLKTLATTDTGNKPVAGAFFGKTNTNKRNPYEYLKEYLDATRNKEWKDIDQSTFWGTLRRLFTDTRSGEYQKAFSEMKSAQNRYNEKLENLHLLLKELPEEARKDVIDYIENVKGKEYSPEVRELGDFFKNTIKSIQDELKEAGFSPEYIDKYGINYVARLYEDKLGFGRVKNLFTKSAKDKIYSPKGERGLVKTMSEKELQEAIKNGEINPEMIGKPLIDGGIEIVPLANKKGFYKVKRDWTPEERNKMGQIKDADVVLPLTLMRLNSMKVLKDFFENVSNIEGATIDLKEFAKQMGTNDLKKAEAELQTQGYVKLPNNESYGALAGKMVRKDVADDIKYLHKQIFDDNKISEIWRKYLTAWKKSKTIYNTSAHFNNFVNNLALANYAGMPLKDVPKYFTQAFKDLKEAKKLKDLELKFLKGEATEQDLEKMRELQNKLQYVKEAKNMGLLDTSMLQDVLDYGRKEDSAENLIGGKGVLGKVANKATELYQAEDNIGKFAMYKALREQGYSPQDAKDMVTLFMPDYSKSLPAGIRFLRDSAISPFISWSYYVLPNLVRYTFKDIALGIKNKNAKQALKGLTNPAMKKLLGTIALIEGLQYALTNGKVSPLADINPADETKPSNMSFIRMGIGADGNTIHTLKIDRLLPQLMVNPLSPKAWVGQAQQTFSGITPSLFFALQGVKMYNGRPITYDSRPKARQIYDTAKYYTESYAPVPATLQQAYDTFIDPIVKKALYPKQKKKGVQLYKDRNFLQNILKLATGINTLSYDQRVLRNELKRKKKK